MEGLVEFRPPKKTHRFPSTASAQSHPIVIRMVHKDLVIASFTVNAATGRRLL